VELNPPSVWNYRKLGLAYETTGEISLAIDAFRKAIEVSFN
jgi:tetratricopeptide (TPR) repeat protein